MHAAIGHTIKNNFTKVRSYYCNSIGSCNAHVLYRKTDQFLSKRHLGVPAATSQVTLLIGASVESSTFTSLMQCKTRYISFDSDDSASEESLSVASPHGTSKSFEKVQC